MENSSKKRKRGRPRKNALQIDFLKSHGEGCDRTHQNLFYAGRAANLIKGDPACRWLFDEDAVNKRKAKFRKGVLSELGRITDDNALVAMARLLAKEKFSDIEAAANVRRFRLRKGGLGRTEQLYAVIITAINNYAKNFPETPKSQIVVALKSAILSVEKSYGRSE